MKKKVYRPPPPKDAGKLPSEIAINELEKALRGGAGAYCEVHSPKVLAEKKPWWKRGPPGIVRHFPSPEEIKKTLFFVHPNRKKRVP